MQWIQGLGATRNRSAEGGVDILTGSVLTLGNFDGVHRGHQSLISDVVSRAKLRGIPSVLMTFEPHPVQLLFPERRLKRLFPVEDLREQAEKFGLDVLVIEPFTQALAALTAEKFLVEILVPSFQPKEMVVGHDFNFGANRSGDIPFLEKWSLDQSIQLAVHAPFEIDGERVSSQQIRTFVAEGEMKAAARFLGRNFYLESIVEKGAGRGRQIQVPTINMRLQDFVLPKPGVYVTRVKLADRTLRAVSNLGVSPTFGTDGELKLETHILNFNEDLYGKKVRVEFLEFLRPEKKFSGIAELTTQIRADIEIARTFKEEEI
jgi:riboflavin kinase / FMN adenylyltransferase